MHAFTKIYLAVGVALVALWAVGEATGGLVPTFGGSGDVDTSSRQGYWYTYRRPTYDAGPGRSPGGHGGSYGSGGYQGGK